MRKYCVLAKGLNFAISPPDVCAEEFVIATEVACRKLDKAEATQLRAKVASVLKSSKPPCQNVTKEELKAIKDLKKAANYVTQNCLCSSKQRSSWFDKVIFIIICNIIPKLSLNW